MAQENLKYEITPEGNIIFDLEAGIKMGDVTHKEVEMREILGVDEEAVAKAEIRNNIGRTITTLLANTVLRIGELTPESFKKRSEWEKLFKKMTLGDRDIAMLMLRIVGKGNAEMRVETKCPNPSCAVDIDHYLDLSSDIEYRPLEVDPEGFQVELVKPHKDTKHDEMISEVTLRLPNGEDQESLDAIGRKNPGQANTNLLVRCMVKFGQNDIFTPLMARQMSMTNREALIKELAQRQHGPRFDLNLECPACGEEIKQGVHPVNFL